MVYYIRFLKSPKVFASGPSRYLVKALMTITTDLGDAFCPYDVDIETTLIPLDEADPPSAFPCLRSSWKGTMRCLWIEVVTGPLDQHVRLSVTSQDGPNLSTSFCSILSSLPSIVALCSDRFSLSNGETAGNIVQRSFRTGSNVAVSIYEESGESIACHIW